MDDDSIKAAITLSEVDYKALKSLYRNVPDLLKQRIETQPLGICTNKRSFIYHFTKDTMSKLIPAGIPQYLYSYLLNFELKPLLKPPDTPWVFDIEDLQFGFVVWLIACSVSIMVFVCEILWRYFKRKFKRTIAFLIGIKCLLDFVRNQVVL